MKAGVAILTAAGFLTAASSQAQGTLQITFDGPPLQPPGSDYAVTSYSESGMSFGPIPPSYRFGRVFPSYPEDPQNGTAYLRAGLGASLIFGFTDGSTFSVVSVDLAEYSTGFSGQPATVPFIGYHPDGSMVTTSLITDGIIDGTGPLADFQTFDFNTQDWNNLTRVEVPSFGWSLDNLVVSVPEPSVGVLLLIGGLALGALKVCNRRRQQRFRLSFNSYRCPLVFYFLPRWSSASFPMNEAPHVNSMAHWLAG